MPNRFKISDCLVFENKGDVYVSEIAKDVSVTKLSFTVFVRLFYKYLACISKRKAE